MQVPTLAVAILASAAQGAAPSPGAVSIAHDGVGCVVAGKFAVLKARLEPGDRASKARAYFRAAGGEHWYSVEMQPQEGAFAATLPKPGKDTPRIEYYLEAVDTALGASRTQEYAPEVVRDAGVCSKKGLAPVLGSAKLAVGGAPGAPPLPPGFSASGLTPIASATGAVAVTVQGISGTVTCTPSSSFFQCPNGTSYQTSVDPARISPTTVAPGASATVRATLAPSCTNRNGQGIYGDFAARLTVQTSCGAVNTQPQNTYRLTLE